MKRRKNKFNILPYLNLGLGAYSLGFFMGYMFFLTPYDSGGIMFILAWWSFWLSLSINLILMLVFWFIIPTLRRLKEYYSWKSEERTRTLGR